MTKVEQQIACAACTWNKNCIEPPSMTAEEVEAKMEEAKGKGEDSAISGLMSAMFFGGKDRECYACPIFIEVLRSSPDLSQRIKSIMQES